MSRRLTLEQLRSLVLDEVGYQWVTPTEVAHRLDLGGYHWYRVALVCERLVNDGEAELKRPGSGIRRFRRRRPA